MNDAVQRWTVRGKMIMKLSRNVGVPSELKSQYKDFIRQGNLDQIENTADPTQSNLFLALSAALRKQTPAQDLPTILQQAESNTEHADAVMTDVHPAATEAPAPRRTEQLRAEQQPTTVPDSQQNSITAASSSTSIPATQSAPKVAAPPAASNASVRTASTPTSSAIDVELDSQNNTNQAEAHDLPFEEDTSTPRKKRTKFSMDALADWQQALKEKVIDWTSTNFTLVESVDDIMLVDDPTLFVIEEQDSGITNGSLFRRVLRSSVANKPLRLVWGVAGLDSVFKVCQAITTKVCILCIQHF